MFREEYGDFKKSMGSQCFWEIKKIGSNSTTSSWYVTGRSSWVITLSFNVAGKYHGGVNHHRPVSYLSYRKQYSVWKSTVEQMLQLL